MDLQTDDKQPKKLPFPIAGIGASAGGLDAFSQLLTALPADTGMAFVLVQHLDPLHESQLAGIVSRTTAMPVKEVEDGMVVEPNHVYVIPPNTSLTIFMGALRLAPRSFDNVPHLPVDLFFDSLAEEQGRLSVGVILSGNGSDGSQGLRAIKSQCGITFVQEESTAKFSGMPRSAIATGVVDFVRSPAGIAAELVRISHHPYVVPPPEEGREEVLPDGDGELKKIFALLQRATRVDFTHYKQTTLRRRIGRRMIVRRSDTLGEYLQFLNEHPEELQELYQDMLICVTRFFRDPHAFTALSQHLSASIRAKKSVDAFRVWVVGCATGEEVYSLAILMLELFQQEGVRPALQLFGTDISEVALTRARAGVYPEGIEQDVSASRLGQYFRKTDTGYQISKSIRDACVFAKQDVTRDPPFGHVDLISCRNMLIYLGPALQKTVLPLFHYSLNPDGVLFLGPAETIGTATDLFQPLDGKLKIFTRKSVPSRFNFAPPVVRNPAEPLPVARPVPMLDRQDLQKKADHIIQNRYAPDAVVVNQNLQIIHFRGRTGFYIESGRGEAGQNLLLMARDSIQVPLRQAVTAAIGQDKAVQHKGLKIEHQGEEREINLEVTPIPGSSAAERYYLVVFEQVSFPNGVSDSQGDPARPETVEEENLRLRQELAEAREYLRSIREEHEAALEEQRASNEEISSANEELQSINEELSTTKEELQSANEELTTVNEELHSRNHELGILNDDLNNLLLAASTPILMVDRSLQLRRLTPAAEEPFGLTSADLGRSIGELGIRSHMPQVDHLVREVISTLVVANRELQDHDGCWWSVGIRPYRTSDHRIEGAVLTFSDIDSLKRSLQATEEARDYADAIVQTVREPLVVLTPELNVERANEAFYRTFEITKERTDGHALYELDGGEWDIPQLRHLLDEVLPNNSIFEDFLVEHEFPRIGTRSMSLTGRKVVQRDQTLQRILLAIEDITDRQLAEKKLLRSYADLERFGYVVAHDLQEPLRSVGSYTQLLSKRYKGQLDAEADKFILIVAQGIARMQAMIRDLLAFSQAGVLENEPFENVNSERALAEALLSLQSAVEDSGASITSGDLPTVPYREPQLVQVFQNLVGNAIKYRGEAVPQIHISATRNEWEWVFSVRDNGIGFEKELADQIFGVFKRLHGNKFAGTGIGLAICQRIIEGYGGRIWAESEPGIGSNFYFTVPAS